MGQNIAMNVGSALTRIEFKDEDGIVLGFLKINLTDIRLVGKLNECAEFFKNYKFAGTDIEKLANIDRDLAEKFCYVLGYDCRETLFGVLSPTTILDDGNMFAISVLNKISEVFSAEVKKKAAARAEAMRKYTEKYQTPVS